MNERLLITGASGNLGRRTARRAAAAGWSVVGTYFTAPTDEADDHLDVRDRNAVRDLIQRVRPTAVVHTAAGRDDWRTIADGAAHVAVATAALGIRLVHVSSDAIFSGREVHYDESALPDPVYRYAAAKAAAETAVRAIDPTAAVVRTSLILGDGDGGHERLTRALIEGTTDGVMFTDQMVARRDGLDPTRLPAGTIAERGLRLPPDVRLTLDRATALLRTRLRGAHEFMAVPPKSSP